jgi:hypothetical protein
MKKSFLFASLWISSVVLLSCSDDDNKQTVKELMLFTSSNTSGMVSVTDLLPSTPVVKQFMVNSTDADGIYYHPGSDQLIQASRSNNRLEVYGNFKQEYMNNASSLTLTGMSTADFTNAREIAASGNMIVVAQDQAASNSNMNKLFVYEKSASGLQLQKTFEVDFKLWGIQFDGTSLYAVVDLTSDLVVFNNFLSNNSGPITPTKNVTIEGLIRTHGIAYSFIEDVMVLSDVGAASSDVDGGLVVIKNFKSVFNATANNGTIMMDKQLRIYGPNSMLGNPVDVAYDNVIKMIYVAERANGGGRLLSYMVPTTSGDYSPMMNRLEPGCTAVFLYRK